MNEQRTTILVIEDEEILRESLVDYLEDRNFRVLSAENGKAGLKILDQEQPSLILTDLRMPEVDGLEVMRRAKEKFPDIPLIVVSGTGNIGDVITALRLGAHDYVLKPIEDMAIILHAVENSLERVRLLRENREYQLNLEHKVAARTLEIEAANEQLRGINQRLRKVVETTRSLSMCQETGDFGLRLLEEFANHMQATGGSIYLVEEAGLRRLHALGSDHSHDFIPFPLPENSVLKHTIEGRSPLLIQDIGEDPRVEPSGWKGYQNGSLLTFPLLNEENGIAGIITLHNKSAPPFINQDKDIGAILAAHSCETLRAVRVMNKLRESEARFRELVELLPEAIFETDLDIRPLFINQRVFEMFGYTQEDLDRNPMGFNIFTPEDRKRAVQNFSRRLAGENIGTQEYTGLRKDGSRFPMLMHAVPLYRDGEVVGSRGIVIDITESKKVEEELHQAQKMESIGRLAGGVAHDFNNMLSVILGRTDMAHSKIDAADPLHADLEEIRKAATRSANLTRQLLAFARKQAVVQQVLELNDTIGGLLTMLKRIIGEDIDLDWQPGENLWLIKIDPSQIDQIIMNLCVNARDAIDNIGKITIKTENTVINDTYRSGRTGFLPGEYVLVTVSDTGHGMDQNILSHIFEPFFTTKEVGKGTGLGLATVYGIVKQNNGLIDVRSEPGQGTSFEIYLPRYASGLETPRKHSAKQPVNVNRLTILLVEDEPPMLDVVTEMLEMMGNTVIAAGTPDQAFALAKMHTGQINLLITDVIMPTMNGRDLAQALLSRYPTLRCLFISGYTEDVIAHHGVMEGDVHFIQKPFSRRDLAAGIEKVFAEEQN